MGRNQFIFTICLAIVYISAGEKCNNGVEGTFKNTNIVEDQIPTIVLYENSTIKEYIDKGQRKRFSIPLPESSPISITITPTQEVTWRLVFNNTLTLVNITTSTTRKFSLSCASAGEYDIFVVALSKSHIHISFNLSTGWKFLNWTTPSKVRFQYQPKRQQVLLKWEKSIFDPDQIHYCVSINVHKPIESLCQAFGAALKSSCAKFDLNTMLNSTRIDVTKKIDTSRVNVVCTGTKVQQLLRGMRANTLYYIDVFGIHTGHDNITYRMSADELWFNRSRPIALQEGKWSTGHLGNLGGMAVFYFKIPMRSTSHTLQLFITPCTSMVDINIIKDKKMMNMIHDVYRPRLIHLNNTLPGERYVVRIFDAENYPWPNRVEVQMTITTRKRFMNMPQPPQSLDVVERKQYRTCNSTVIAWNSTLDTREVKYRIFVIREYPTSENYYDNVKLSNYCIENSQLTSHPQFHKVYCTPGKGAEIQQFTITGLSPGSPYIIYVTASLGNGKSLSYQSLKIKTNANCKHKYRLIKYEAVMEEEEDVEDGGYDDDDDADADDDSVEWVERHKNFIEDE